MSIQLAPETEAGLRAEAVARGMDVDALIATAVKAYLCEPPIAAIRRVPSSVRSAEMAWVSSPDVQFFGKWVVLEGGHVVASGSNPKQLYEDVRANGISSPFLIYVSADRVSADRVSPNVQEHFAGGWID